MPVFTCREGKFSYRPTLKAARLEEYCLLCMQDI